MVEELRNATFQGNIRRLNVLIGEVRETGDAASALTRRTHSPLKNRINRLKYYSPHADVTNT
jgi:hypothetical protein